MVEDPYVGAEEAERILRPLGGKPFLVAMGRLSPEKGFDMLLRAFAKVSTQHPHWWLIVIGEGRARSSLEELVRKLGLEGKVLFPGIAQHPHALLRRAGAFVLSSRFEGLPMGLLEAMACSLPCISYDCPNGPRELIRHEVSGLLVPAEDVSSLAQHILRVLDAPSFARQLGVHAAKVAESYSLDSVLPRWDATIAELV
jgi:glycosyltransferase involved in cell wall biosynthesis